MFKVADENTVLKNYEAAKSAYRALGVDTDAVIARYKTIPISLQNWQGDDVGGFEKTSAASDMVVTGNYPAVHAPPPSCAPISIWPFRFAPLLRA